MDERSFVPIFWEILLYFQKRIPPKLYRELQENISAASINVMLLQKNISIHCSFSFQPKGKKVLRNLSYVLCQVEVLAFLFAFLMAGILWGYLENFLFWHLEDLGATKFLMGTYWKIYYLSKSDQFLNLKLFVLKLNIVAD